jgi:ABC-type arginine transport system ATPase subunit
MVLPAELLQVGYTSALRSYLANSYEYLNLVTFEHLIFDGILQETLLLLGIRGDGKTAAIRTLEVKDARALPPVGKMHFGAVHSRSTTVVRSGLSTF